MSAFSPGGEDMRVLLCVDGLAELTSATSWLERMLPAERSELHITAIAQTGPLALQCAASFESVKDRIIDRARQLGEIAAARLEGRWPDLTVRVAEGDPREQLLKAAADSRADLVVVGFPGDGRHLLSPGSLARFAAHQLECSVLLATEAPEVVRTIVVGIDGSASAREAVRLISLAGLTPAPAVFALGVVDTSWRRTIDLSELPAAAHNAVREAETQQAADALGAIAR